MRKIFAQNVLFLVFVNLIVKPLWIFGIDAKVQTTLGNEVYGSYIAFFNLGMILQIILDLGLQSYSTKTVAHAPNTFQKLFPNIIITKLALTLIYFTTLFLVGLALGYPLAAIGMLISIGCIHAFNSFYLFFRSNIASKQLFKTDSILSVLDRLLLILLCGVLLYVPYYAQYFSIQTFIVLQICTLGIASIVGYYLCNKHFHISWHHLGFQKIKVILKKGIPFAVLVLVMSLYMRGDAILVEKLLGAKAAGQYAMYLRLLDVANNMSGVLIAGMLLSFFSKHLKDVATIEQIVTLCTKVLIPFDMLAALLSFQYGNNIMLTVYRKQENYDAYILGLIIIAYIFYCCMYIYSTLLTANGNLKALIKISAVAAVINMVGNFMLLPQYQLLGAAFMHAITVAFVAIACIILASKTFRVVFIKLNDLLQFAFYAISFYAATYFINLLNLNYIVEIVLIGSFAFINILAFNYKAIIRQIKKR